jgi:hypothetical protein
MKIGAFGLRHIEETGVRHLSGVPGPLQALRDTAALHWMAHATN